MADVRTSSKNPSWWDDSHSSGWDRTKEALRRDWEQTKSDLTDGGQELNQGLDDTVKQAAGKQPIPPPGMPNRDITSRGDWNSMEPAVRYGYGARHYYAGAAWDDELENKMRRDWDATESDSTWEQVKNAVKRGWESVKRAV